MVTGTNNPQIRSMNQNPDRKPASILAEKWEWVSTHSLGRDLSIAEIRPLCNSLPKSRPASMGPRSFNRGNVLQALIYRQGLSRFNGAAIFQSRKLAW